VRTGSLVVAVVLLALATHSCGAARREEPRQAAPRARPERQCTERLLCNAPVCSCPEGYGCVVLCDEPRPGCAECVAR
jgi:hypothetical protein